MWKKIRLIFRIFPDLMLIQGMWESGAVKASIQDLLDQAEARAETDPVLREFREAVERVIDAL